MIQFDKNRLFKNTTRIILKSGFPLAANESSYCESPRFCITSCFYLIKVYTYTGLIDSGGGEVTYHGVVILSLASQFTRISYTLVNYFYCTMCTFFTPT